jgi:hypothetical protein
VISPVVESVEVGRERDLRVIYHDGTGRRHDVSDSTAIRCGNGHATALAGKIRGRSLGSTPVTAEYKGLKAHALFHVFEHPIEPLSNRWDPEHGGGYYLSVSPSSITMEKVEGLGDFVVTLHAEDGSVKTVAPTRVVPCQPHLVTFADGRATAHDAGPATLGFVYRLEKGAGTDLTAVCYVTVVNNRQHPLQQ